jgi:tripartite-type tricarboxylate transporter receptor subunit TctC
LLPIGSGAPDAHGQAFPSKPVRIVVGASPGGGIDIVARMLGAKMTGRLGQQVIVENRPGAGTTIGGDVVARSAPDGHTVFMASTSFSISAGLYRKLAYDPPRDLTGVTLVASGPLVLIVHPSVPAKNVGELVALAKARPGKLTFASGGTGSSLHLAGEIFKSQTGVDMVHVPYKGGAPALVDLMAGQVDLMFQVIVGLVAHVKAGKLRALAVTSTTRSRLLPELPTLSESGLPGFDVVGWFGLLAPAATPKDIVDTLHAAALAALNDPEVSARLSSLGTEPIGKGPEHFSAYFRAEVARWKKVIDSVGIATQ